MKKTNLVKTLSILALASTAFVFAGCGKKKQTTQKKDDGNTKYDKTLKVEYKVFNGEAEITRIDEQGETFNIPSTIDGNVVRRISCTYTSENLKKVVIPETLTYLNGNGFMECVNLEEVEFTGTSSLVSIPSKAFLGTKISSIEIPASVRSISYEAFQNVDTLTSVTFADESNLTTIGPFSFYDCEGLTTIAIPSSVEVISQSAFEKCVNLANLNLSNATSLTTIDQYAFSGCEKITSLNFTPNKALKTIDANAFRGCINMTSVTFDDALQTIGNKAFYNTQKMTSIVIPEKVTTIGDEAFVNSGISSIEIKSGSDTFIGVNAFSQYELVGDNLIPLEKITSLTINGNLSVQKVFTDYAPQVRNSLTTLHITGDKIAANAFKNCSNLENLTIDNTVKAMGESAFEECTKIEQVQLNDGLKELSRNVFKNCINLDTVVLPGSVVIIRQGAFDGCVKVNVNLVNVKEIGAYAFRNTAIITPTFSENLSYIGEYAFDGCLGIESVTVTAKNSQIRQCAFINCTNIKTIDLSSSTVVESFVFEGDTKVESISVNGKYGLATLFGDSQEYTSKQIKTIEIKEGTTVIEADAFNGCMLVTQITIPDTVEEIGDYAFAGCKGITELLLPESLTKIGEYAFSDCEKLVMEHLPSGITKISDGLFLNDAAMGTFTLNEGTTKIGYEAFSGCSNINLTLIDSITSIGDYAFSGCLNLTVSELPESVVEIGERAFNGCLLVSINKTTENLNRIGEYAFAGCKAITSFEFEKDLVATDSLGFAILSGCTKVEVLKIFGTTSLERLFGDSVAELKPVLSQITIKDGSTELAENMFKGFTAISSVTFENGSLITKLGDGVFDGCSSLVAFPSALDSLEEIGSRAFAESGLTTITLPANGLKLGTQVFAGCQSLAQCVFEFNAEDDTKNITSIPAGTFMNTILVTVTIPDSVISIGEGAFKDIKTLKEVNITALSKLTEIDDSAFEGSSNLYEIQIPKDVVKVGDGAFKGCFALRTVEYLQGSKIEVVNAETFYNCYALTTINLPATIAKIYASAFYNCECLFEIELPEGLDFIGERIFEGAKSLNDIVIPEKIVEIPDYAFKNCKSLTTIYWNTNAKTIGEEAFFNTPCLTQIPASISSIGASAFASEDEEPHSFVGQTVNLGVDTTNGVSLSIMDGAFENSGLTGLVLGSKIVEIGNSVFTKSAVKSVDFKYLKITKIGDYMFDACEALETLVMADTTVTPEIRTSVNTIGIAAFRGCTALKTFDFKNMLAIGAEAFEEDAALYVDVELGVGNNVTIGEKAFYKAGIKTLTLGAKVIQLGANAFAETTITKATLTALNITAISASFFENCTQLAEVYVNPGIKTIGASAFNNTAITSLSFLSQTAVEQIMDGAFNGCTHLQTADIPVSVTYIGKEAFKGCSTLNSVTWSKSCNVINDDTFAGCSSLTAFTVEANVSRIGVNVFNAQGAQTLTFLGELPPSVDEKFCASYTNVTFKVPSGKTAVYLKNYVFGLHAGNITE